MKNLFGDIGKIAIERLQEFEPNALEKNPAGYYVAYSGGKDSDVILDLVRRSGVKYTAHHHLTTCDPPELVGHVKQQSDVMIRRPEMSMWQLIRYKKMPPRRNARYCCQYLKEGGGHGRLVVTGIRWGESARRSKRRMIETCYRNKTKQFLNVIVDWSTDDVWGYIKQNKIEYCKLYDEGFKRLGCVLCPMARNVDEQIKRWPKIAAAWEKAIKATWKPQITKTKYSYLCHGCKAVGQTITGSPNFISITAKWTVRCPSCGSENFTRETKVITTSNKFVFTTPEEYWQWWLDRDRSSKKTADNQRIFFED